MPSKSANVKNEKQYEALKDKGMSKQRAAKIANSPDASKKGRQGQRRRQEAERQQPRRDDRSEEEGRQQGRQGHRQEELTAQPDGTAALSDSSARPSSSACSLSLRVSDAA